MGPALVGVVVLALAGLASVIPPWVDGVWPLALAFSAWFFFNDAAMAPAWACCTDVGERYAGTLGGAMNMTGAFLGAAGVKMAGRLLRLNNDHTVFIVFGCSYALAALCCLMVDVTKPLVPPTEEEEP